MSRSKCRACARRLTGRDRRKNRRLCDACARREHREDHQ